MRAICAETIMKWPTPNANSYDEGLEYCRRFIGNWKGHPLILPAVGPHAPYTCTPEILRETARLAQEQDVPLLIHIAETAGEAEASVQAHGLSPALYADQFGVLDHRAVVAHGVHLTERGLKLLAKNYHGRRGEVDLIMRDRDTVVFVEFRYRRSAAFGGALESVTRSKQQKLRLTAEQYLQQETRLTDGRFDVVAMSDTVENNGSQGYTFEWIKNAF